MNNRVALPDDVVDAVAGGYLDWTKNPDGSGKIWIYHIDANGVRTDEKEVYNFRYGDKVEEIVNSNRDTCGDKTILGMLYKEALIW